MDVGTNERERVESEDGFLCLKASRERRTTWTLKLNILVRDRTCEDLDLMSRSHCSFVEERPHIRGDDEPLVDTASTSHQELEHRFLKCYQSPLQPSDLFLSGKCIFVAQPSRFCSLPSMRIANWSGLNHQHEGALFWTKNRANSIIVHAAFLKNWCKEVLMKKRGRAESRDALFAYSTHEQRNMEDGLLGSCTMMPKNCRWTHKCVRVWF
jgi:hypothetical protein